MARLSEITEKIKSQDTITGAQAEEQIMLLGAIRDQMKLSNIQLYNINKTMLDTMSAERRNNDKLLLAFRESEMEKKKEELRGTSADEDRAPRGGGFGFGDLLIPAFLAWQAGLDSVIRAISAVPTILSTIQDLVVTGVSGGFEKLKSVIQTRLVTPMSNVIEGITSGRYYDDFKMKMADLNIKFRDNILEPTKGAIKNATTKTFSALSTKFDELKTAFKSNVLDKLDEAFLKIKNLPETDAFKRISSIIDGLKESFKKNIFDPVFDAYFKIMQSDTFISLSKRIDDFKGKFQANVIDEIVRVASEIKKGEFYQSISRAVTQLKTSLETTIAKVSESVVKTATKVSDATPNIATFAMLKEKFSGWKTSLGEKLGKSIDLAKGALPSGTALSGMMAKITNTVGKVGGVFSSIGDSASAMFKTFSESKIGSFIKSVPTAPLKLLSKLNPIFMALDFGKGALEDNISGGLKEVLGGFARAADFAIDYGREFMGGIKLPEEEKNVFEKIVNDTYKSWGRDFLKSIFGDLENVSSYYLSSDPNFNLDQKRKEIEESRKKTLDNILSPFNNLFTPWENRKSEELKFLPSPLMKPELEPKSRLNDRPPVVIGHVGNINNTTTGGGAVGTTGNIGVSTQIMPNGFYQLETGGLGLYAIP